MKMIYGNCESSKEISLSKAAKILSKFVSVENGASQAINAYLRRTSAGFDELKQIHKELKTSHSHKKKKKKNHKKDTTMDDEGVRVVKKTNQEELSNGRLKSESVVVDDDDDGEKSTLTAVNENGSEKHKKKNKNKKQEIDGDSKLEFGEREADGIQADNTNSGIEEGKKQKKEKNKNKHKNVEGGENGGLVGSQEIKTEQRKKRKFEDVEDKSGDLTDKRIKRKH